MHVPEHYAVTDRETLFNFMTNYSFALLISTGDGEPIATHLPLLLDRDAGPSGTLRGHLARANPHARELEGRRVLAIFHGPHAYVSPTWYQAERTVPTWNYVAVHAYGVCRLVGDEAELLRTLADSVAVYERGRPTPWAVDVESRFVRGMAAGIVGIRIELDRLEGKWKLNQNHPADRRERVAAALLASTDTNEREIGRLMAEGLADGRGGRVPT
jgi:transcriptional regulator